MRGLEKEPVRQERKQRRAGGSPAPGPCTKPPTPAQKSVGISVHKWRGTHTFGVHVTVQKTYKGCGRVGYSPYFSTHFKQKLLRSLPAQGQAIYLHGGWAGGWEGQGLDKCPEGWGSSHWCEGQSRNLSWGGGGNDDRDERHLGQCSQSPCPAQQGKTLAGLGQGGAREQGPETTDKRSGPEKARAITCSVQMVVETTGPSLQGNCPRASSWVGNTRS